MLSDKWQKATYSGGQGGQCVEARKAREQGMAVVQFRDSKLGTASPIISLTPSAFRAMLRGIKTP